MNTSPYQILGMTPPSNPDEISNAQVARAYRRACLQAHPDKLTGSQEQFERVQSAYEAIKTVQQRTLLEKYGSRQAPGPGHALGFCIDKLPPLALGFCGGLLSVATAVVILNHKSTTSATTTTSAASNVLNSVLLIGVLSVGGGPILSYKAPLFEVLTAGAGGMLVGSSVGGFLYGIAWSCSRLFSL